MTAQYWNVLGIDPDLHRPPLVLLLLFQRRSGATRDGRCYLLDDVYQSQRVASGINVRCLRAPRHDDSPTRAFKDEDLNAPFMSRDRYLVIISKNNVIPGMRRQPMPLRGIPKYIQHEVLFHRNIRPPHPMVWTMSVALGVHSKAVREHQAGQGVKLLSPKKIEFRCTTHRW